MLILNGANKINTFNTLMGCEVEAASMPKQAGHFRPDINV